MKSGVDSMNIGGNITAQVQVKTETGSDRLGKPIFAWETVHSLTGFLDLLSGDSRYTNYNAKIQESTHIFLCDYKSMNVKIDESRVVIDGQTYDLKLIDDPMNLHDHLEIFLAFVG